jgi:hypothetical protein
MWRFEKESRVKDDSGGGDEEGEAEGFEESET